MSCRLRFASQGLLVVVCWVGYIEQVLSVAAYWVGCFDLVY